MGNIPARTAPDPWPKYGLIAAYKPFILRRLGPFFENNRHLDRDTVITDAIRIAWECSRKFKPELGFDFSTYLRHWLPNRLYRLYGIEKAKAGEDPDILETEPLVFSGRGNGARLVLDTGDLIVGARMTGNDLGYLTGILERIRADAGAVPHDHEHATAFLRAIVDHAERREREALAEAEQGGVILLDPHDLQADVRLFEDNRLLRFKPQLIIRDREPVDMRGYRIEEARQDRRPFRRRKQHVYTKPDVPLGAFDQEAWELDQFAKHAGLTDLEQIALMLMRTNTRKTDAKSPTC
jgi:hypothetical protein